jgi:hypothetical protein
MPKGVRDHQHTSEGSIENLYLKVGEADPNNEQPSAPTALLPEEQRKIFVQVAALNSMNSTDTFEFMRKFVRPDICHKDVANMIDAYRAEILNARTAVSLYVDQKFPSFNPFRQAEVINDGLSLCQNLLVQYGQWVTRAPKPSPQYEAEHEAYEVEQQKQEMAAKWVDRASRGLSSVTKSYESWSAQKVEWGKMVDAIIADFAAQRNPAQASKLDPRKISAVAKHIGVDDFIADRLAQLLVYGEQKLGRSDEEVDGTSKYFEDESDGGSFLQGIDGAGVRESGDAGPDGSGHSLPDSADHPTSDGSPSGREAT